MGPKKITVKTTSPKEDTIIESKTTINNKSTTKTKFIKYPNIVFRDQEILNIDVKKLELTPPQEFGKTYKNFRSEIFYNENGKRHWLYIFLQDYFSFGLKQFDENKQDSAYSINLSLLSGKLDDLTANSKQKIFEKIQQIEKQIRTLFVPYSKTVGKDWIDKYEYFEANSKNAKDFRLISYTKNDTEKKQPTLKSNLWTYAKDNKTVCGTSIFQKNKVNSKGNQLNFNKSYTKYKDFATVSAIIHIKSVFISSQDSGVNCIQCQLMEIEFPEDYGQELQRQSLMHQKSIATATQEDIDVENNVNEILTSSQKVKEILKEIEEDQ